MFLFFVKVVACVLISMLVLTLFAVVVSLLASLFLDLIVDFKNNYSKLKSGAEVVDNEQV